MDVDSSIHVERFHISVVLAEALDIITGALELVLFTILSLSVLIVQIKLTNWTKMVLEIIANNAINFGTNDIVDDR